MFKNIRDMCTPASIYFVLSIFTLLVMIISNIGNKSTLCVGNYDCPVDNLLVIFLLKLGYILFATIVLDSLCKNGYGSLSWILLFFPLLAYFVALGLFMIYRNSTIIMIDEEVYN